QCRFASWLEAEGQARHATHPAFLSIEPLHRQAHVLATALCKLKAQNRSAEALDRLGELHTLRDALLEQLQILVQKNQTPY
ncbi:diguanylate cyclase, partial [bacterium]|nr:diguanylate cyclase [bacterium]